MQVGAAAHSKRVATEMWQCASQFSRYSPHDVVKTPPWHATRARVIVKCAPTSEAKAPSGPPETPDLTLDKLPHES